MAQCGNISFESGSFNGWKGKVGCVTNQLAINTNCADASQTIDPAGGLNSYNGQHAILTPGFNSGSDPLVPAIKMVSPLNDKYIARLGDYEATTITRSFARGAFLEYEYQVTELNALVTLYFAIVLQDPDDHDLGDRPFFLLELEDPNGNSVECIEYAGIPGFQKFDRYFYRNWTPVSINLYQYAGNKVKLRVTTSDCGQEAHLGYAYLDATCQEPVIRSNREVLCPGDDVELIAPPGMESYAWRHQESGNTIVGTTESIVVDKVGTYTCSMVPFSTSSTSCPFELKKVIRNPRGSIDPRISLDKTVICSGDAVTMENVSVKNNTDISSLEWRISGSYVVKDQTKVVRTLSQVGTHQIELKIIDLDGCEFETSTQVEVVPPPNPQINAAGPFCTDDPPFTLQKSPPNGVWAGTGVNANGVFNPAQAGFQNSPHNISYTVTQVCTRTDNISIVVNKRKNPTINPVQVLCNDGSPVQLTAAENGGVWSGPGVNGSGLFNPAAAGPGKHTVKYAFLNACPTEDEIEIEVVRRKNPAVADPGSFCVSDAPYQLQPVEPGGRWSGNGVDPQTGVFDPSVAGAGTHTIVHNFDGPCPSQRILQIRVILKANADFTAPTSICENDVAADLIAQGSGGNFSGPGVFGSKFNPAQAGPGTHPVQYLIPGACGDTVVKNIVVHPYFDPSISNPGILCTDRQPFELNAAAPPREPRCWPITR
ncbi:MAG: hypothetical protein ACPF8V_01710 [Luteibaculum sp.]